MSALTLLSIRVRRSRIAVQFRDAILSMRMRRWLREPEPRKIRIDHYARRLRSLETGFGSGRWWVEEDDCWPEDDDDGLAGSRIPRRPVVDPGSASATLTFDEYDLGGHGGWAE
jgi:hypothetical protein